MKVVTIINYCTNDYRFLRKCILECSIFSEKIIVPVCDHFFDGSEENRDLLQASYQENPETLFLEYAYLKDDFYSPYVEREKDDPQGYQLWHSASRYIGFLYAGECESILFVDVDEIIEGDKMLEYLEHSSPMNAVRFQAYYYFREARFRATGKHQAPLLVKKEIVTPLMVYNPYERFGLLQKIPERKREYEVGVNGKPFVHHYSGVKTKEEWLKKANSWGHRGELDFPKLIEEEYAQEFQGKDFTYGFSYETVTPYFDPFIVSSHKKGPSANVLKLSKEDVVKKELEYSFGL
ncbi:MAG TPA: hypothetical protein VLG44_01385 [Chlamydiales bacterium]|nr:hypothetical protein [Chlamydiales bacterium]